MKFVWRSRLKPTYHSQIPEFTNSIESFSYQYTHAGTNVQAEGPKRILELRRVRKYSD
jgi:hypothetical protein